jgi:hypothetical protein
MYFSIAFYIFIKVRGAGTFTVNNLGTISVSFSSSDYFISLNDHADGDQLSILNIKPICEDCYKLNNAIKSLLDGKAIIIVLH